jgi:cell division protein FtsX
MRQNRAVRPCLLLVLPAAVVLTACGGSHRSASVADTKFGLQACGLRVYFARQATHAQEQAAGTKLRDEPAVQHITFVSKAQALAQFKKNNPGISKAIKLPLNPLPDAYTVVPTSPSGVRAIRGSIAHTPGVDTVKLTPCSLTR